MTNQHALISIRNICKDFKKPNGAIFTALEGVSFDVYENEFVISEQFMRKDDVEFALIYPQ